jgi:hypothetical protein
MPPLENPRDELVAQGLAAGRNKTQACKEAGYKGARAHASRKTRKVNIRQRVAEIQAEKVKNFVINKAWVTDMLVENVQRAMQAIPVKNENGEAVGEFRYNGAVANKSLELLARILGMLVDKSEMTMKRDYSDLSGLELLQLLAREARELELLEHTGRVIDAEAVDFRAMKRAVE